MKLRVVSDLHFEFHPDFGVRLASQVTSGEYDVLVVAGDLCNARLLDHSVSLLAASTKRPIVFVPGNHEFYGSDLTSVYLQLIELEQRFSHFNSLSNRAIDVEGVRFVGTPLWFRKVSGAPTWAMSDYSQISGFASRVHSENEAAIEFLVEEVNPFDVVITHYLPTKKSIHPQYKDSPLNVFFLCDVEHLIRGREPALWIHGHTHSSCRYRMGSTDVVCNPRGYVGTRDENPVFDPFLTIDDERI